MGTIFTCEMCGEVCESEWTDEEAMAEASALFAEEELEDAATICDECWQLMMGNAVAHRL